MKMRGLLFFLFVMAGFITSAQDWSTGTYKYGEQYEGYVVDAEGKKIEGYIKYRNRSVMQEEVIFYKIKDNSSTKKKYYAKDLIEYKVGDKLYHCIPYSGGASLAIRGNLVVNGEGCIKEYVWYKMASGHNTLKKHEGESDEDFGNRKFPSTTVFYKDSDDIGVTKKFFEDAFSKKVTQYVSSNKALAKKVKSKQSGYSKMLNLRAIFKEFNDSCK